MNGTVAIWDPVALPILDQLEDKMLHGKFSIQMDSMSGNLCKSYNTERHEVEYHPLALLTLMQAGMLRSWMTT